MIIIITIWMKQQSLSLQHVIGSRDVFIDAVAIIVHIRLHQDDKH